jgi:hypothetical protein
MSGAHTTTGTLFLLAEVLLKRAILPVTKRPTKQRKVGLDTPPMERR